MEVYGLTGGIGSGKSTVAEMLEEYGIPVVSADELSRMVVAPGSRGLADVVEAFGEEVLDDKGELDRKKMGRIVFAAPERRRELEAILHPRIRERYEQVLDALEKAGHPVMIYEVPLLFEKKLDLQDEMKGVILVTATADTRIARVKARDALTTEDVLARMRAQMPEQEKRARADYIIHNDADLDELRREVEYLISRFLRLPPRTDSSIEAEAEVEAEPDFELDESEIDTLSPEEVSHEAPTAEIDLSQPDPEVEVPRDIHISANEAGELEVAIESTPPVPAGGPPELEVELAPTPKAPVSQAPVPSPAAPVVPVIPGQTPSTAGWHPSPPRPRASTIPQLSIPDLRASTEPAPAATGERESTDEEPAK
jgi:dephospho-CoA kinase